MQREQNKKRVLELFERMTDAQQTIYLRHLEKLQANWKRSHPRRRCQIDVDYDTRDGSCIRDYIHVMDLANAHTKAMQYLLNKKNQTNCEVFNLGIGEGVSVLEAIHAFERVSDKKLKYEIGPRRPGDVVAIYADKKRSEQKLGWKPQRDIDAIMKTAWAWEQERSKS